MWTGWTLHDHCCQQAIQDGLCDRLGLRATWYVHSYYPPTTRLTRIDYSEQAKSHGAIPLNLHSDPHAAILAGTGGRGADAVLEIVGSPPALLLAIDLARVGGVVVSCGVHTHDVVMPGATLYNKNLRFSFGRCPVRAVFAESLETLRSVSKETPELMKHFIQKKVPLKVRPTSLSP